MTYRGCLGSVAVVLDANGLPVKEDRCFLAWIQNGPIMDTVFGGVAAGGDPLSGFAPVAADACVVIELMRSHVLPERWPWHLNTQSRPGAAGS